MISLSFPEWLFVALIFVWSGLVRSGLGFGGAALALPLMLLVINQPLLWLPMLATHLLIFSAITVFNRFDRIDWSYIRRSFPIFIVPKILGVLGLVSLPNQILVYIVYGITFLYGLTYLFNYSFISKNRYVDVFLLILGGYASGVTLMGAPLISAVYARHVALKNLRTTLFFLWIVLVAIKMSTFVLFDVDLQFKYAMIFLPFVGVGHLIGLRLHEKLIGGDGHQYKQVLGAVLVLICGYGIATAGHF